MATPIEQAILGTAGATIARIIYGKVTNESPEEMTKGALEWGLVTGIAILLTSKLQEKATKETEK